MVSVMDYAKPWQLEQPKELTAWPTSPKRIWVLTWKHYDGKAGGVLRAYHNRNRAEADLALLIHDASRVYELTEVEIYQ